MNKKLHNHEYRKSVLTHFESVTRIYLEWIELGNY